MNQGTPCAGIPIPLACTHESRFSIIVDPNCTHKTINCEKPRWTHVSEHLFKQMGMSSLSQLRSDMLQSEKGIAANHNPPHTQNTGCIGMSPSLILVFLSRGLDALKEKSVGWGQAHQVVGTNVKAAFLVIPFKHPQPLII